MSNSKGSFKPSIQLSRRALLRGSGAAIALPFLQAMQPRSARAQGDAPVRYAILYFPCGTTGGWEPTGTETAWNTSEVLRPLDPYKADVSVLVGISSRISSNHPGHASGFLSDHSAPIGGAPFQAAVTADQIIANAVGAQSRMKCLVMTPPGSGETEEGQSGVYASNLSWISPGTPAARQVDAKAIFDALFAGLPAPTPGGQPTPAPAQQAQAQADDRWAKDKSVLDYVLWDANRLKAKLGQSDKAVVDQFFTGVREVEQRIAKPDAVTPPAAMPPATCGARTAPGANLPFAEDTTAKLDLLALAFQCNITRVATYLLDFEYSQRNMSFIPGVTGVHHSISHWKDSSGRLGPMLTKINVFYAEKLAYLVGKLKAMPEGDKTVLANSMIVWASGFNDGHAHTHNNMPMVLAGGGGGKLRPGRMVKPSSSSLKALHLTLMQKMGVAMPSFGGSSATIDNL